MSPPTTTPIVLPVGPSPGWELEGTNDEEEKMQRIPASCVLLHALRQSRQKWLSSTFPLFSTKARGAKSIDHTPPPHAIQLRGRCDLEIGPHIFYDTLFFEVHYLPPQPPVKAPYNTPAQPTTSSSTTQTPGLEEHSTPLISSLTSVVTITPTLINQVNTAASTNPTLANLLRLAAAGLATPEQLKTLGLLIQSLATSETSPPTSSAQPASTSTTARPSTMVFPVKEFDLVLEFRENPSERWVFPRGSITCDRTINSLNSSMSDIAINTCLPFPRTKSDNTATDQASVSSDSEKLQVVSFHVKGAPPMLWETISRWVGDKQKVEQSKQKLGTIKQAEHVYLGYQIPEGPLLTQLQSATAPPYSMKPIKTAATSARSRRKPFAKVKNDSPKPNGGEKSSSKHSRAVRVERSSAAQIQCLSCKSQDVPLIFGGRFCRPCVDSGRATTTYTQPHRFTPYILTPIPASSQDVSQLTAASTLPATQ